MSLGDFSNTGTPDYERWLGQEWWRELDQYIFEKYAPTVKQLERFKNIQDVSEELKFDDGLDE